MMTPTPSPYQVLLSDRSPPHYALHNVALLDVHAGADGHARLLVECAGERIELPGSQLPHPEFIARIQGRMGYLQAAWEPMDTSGYAFQPYVDQSLRRAPELDAPDVAAERQGRRPNVVGWRCEAQPDGFRAPMGLVPGLEGAFIPDHSEAISLRVPHQLWAIGRDYQLTPHDLLQAFVADLCGVRNSLNEPRADGLSSQGSDERDLAEQWLQRAFGHRYLDEEAQYALDAREHPEEDPDHFEPDEFDELLREYRALGGTAEDIVAAIRGLIQTCQTKV